MTFYFPNLDERTRALMLEEIEYDEERHQLHVSPYLSNQGLRDYPALLKEAVADGDEDTLAEALSQRRRIARTSPRRQQQGGYNIVTVPSNAAELLAQDAFNRYYIRALSRRAIEDGIGQLIVYRAKPVQNPRPESEALVETTVDPQALLEDLRQRTDDEPQLGIPGGPNSGISVRLP